MPISTGEWRVRIGRFVRWNHEPNRDLHVHVILETSSNAERSDAKDSSCGDTNSPKNNAHSGSSPNNRRGEAKQPAHSDSEAGKQLGVREVPQTAATRDVARSTGSTTSSESDSEDGKNDASPPTKKEGNSAKPVDASSSYDVTSDRRQGCWDPASASNSSRILEGKNSMHDPSSPPSSARDPCSIKRSDVTPGPDSDAPGERIRDQVSEKSRRRASTDSRLETDVIADNGTPDTTELLLLRSGDVESNPGPNGLPADATSEKGRDFDDILKRVSRGFVKDSEIDDLGKALGFEPTETERYIKTNYRYQHVTSDGTLQMMRDWRKRQTSDMEGPVLKKALYDIGQLRLADDLLPSVPRHGGEADTRIDAESTIVPRGKNTQPLRDDEIGSVAADTKRHYIDTLCRIQADPLDQDTLLHFGYIFTNLTLIEEDTYNKQKEKPLEYKDILKTKVNGLLARRFLVQAEGGAGKTTLCYKIAYDWAHGNGFEQFKLVVVVLLRKVKNKTIGEVVKAYISDNNPVTSDQLDKYILDNPEEVFLVLDGLDEFDGDFSGLHQIVQIILNRLFKLGTVLITSRQWRVHEIRRVSELKMVYALIGIKGFSAENLAVYIKKFFHPDQSSSKDLRDFIEHNDVIRENMAPFPIFVAMLCIMWKEFDGERRQAMSKLKTYSQLLDEMICFLVDHYLSKDKFHADKSMEERYDIVFHHLALIGKIALQGLLERRLVFPEDTFHSCEESKEVGCKVGVLTREKRSTSRRERRQNLQVEASTVQFPHKLFQEYLSARYAASLHRADPMEYDKLVTGIMPKAKEFQYFLYFISSQETEVGLDIITRLSVARKPNDVDFMVDVAYESQDKSVAKIVANHLKATGITLRIRGTMSAHTVSGHLFLMEYRTELNALEVERSCGHSASTDLAVCICSSPSLRSLIITSVTMHDVFYSEFANQAEHSKIDNLEISGTDLSERSAASLHLAQSVCKMSHLKRLVINKCQFHVDFYQTAASIGSSAMNLKISSADLRGRPAASRHLAQFICKMSNLQSLTLHSFRFHDDFYQTAASLGSSATNLEISRSDLEQSPAASGHLAQFICKMTDLQRLKLGFCQFHDDFYQTAASFGSTATNLVISNTKLVESPAASGHLAQFICKMSNLQSFTLHSCRFHDDFYQTAASLGSAAMVDDQHILPSLSDLSFDDDMLKRWQPCRAMFDSVERVTISLWQDLDLGILPRMHVLKGVSELIIKTDRPTSPGLPLKDAQSVSRAIFRAFPRLKKVTFSRLDIGNADMKLILESLREAQNIHLHTFRVIRCGTNEELDAFIHDLESSFRVEIEHGNPYDAWMC